MAAGKDVTLSKDEIKRILQLPPDEEGDAKLEKMLSAFDDKTFSPREKLFILFFTSPMSKTCGKVNKSGQAVGGSWKSWGSWAYQQPHVQEKIKELTTSTSLQEIEDIFREDIKFCRDVLLCDRTSFKKDTLIDLGEKGSFQVIDDKELNELSPKQRKMVAGFEYDKNGHAHYDIETRASARQALLTYHKLLTQQKVGANDNKTSTIVTLEGIRDKATAKIEIIQHNRKEAELAGQFIQPMNDTDEEA